MRLLDKSQTPLSVAIEVQIAAKLVPDASIIFDVGAYDGTHSRVYAQAFPNANVYAFEADFRNYLLGMTQTITINERQKVATTSM